MRSAHALFRASDSGAAVPLRVVFSAMPPAEYEALVHRWPLAWLYRWLLAQHVDHFDKTIRQAIADHKTMKN